MKRKTKRTIDGIVSIDGVVEHTQHFVGKIDSSEITVTFCLHHNDARKTFDLLIHRRKIGYKKPFYEHLRLQYNESTGNIKCKVDDDLPFLTPTYLPKTIHYFWKLLDGKELYEPFVEKLLSLQPPQPGSYNSH